MKNLYKPFAGLKWFPDAAEENAPPGALLRADNTIPDEAGSRSLRLGSTTLYSGLQAQRAQSLWDFTWDGTHYRFAGIDDRVYRNGVDFGETFDGTGDIQFGDDAYQVFMARGQTKKKFDGTTLNNWSIAAPEFPVTLTASTALTHEFATFASGESPAFNINEGSSSFVAGYDGTSSAALALVPDSGTGRASASKTFSSDNDLFNILGADGGNTDLFDIRVWIEEPRKMDKITVMFGLGTGADPFLDDYYYFDFNIRNASTVDVKDAGSNAAAAYALSTQQLQSALSPEEVTNVKSPEAVGPIIERLGRFAGSRSRERQDPQQNSPAWGHLSVTRGQFNRVGGTATRDWSTVRGFKVVVTMTPGSTESTYLDNATFTGGGSRALTGTFRCVYRFAREFQVDGGTVYTELSPISEVSDPVVLNQQALQVTIPAGALSAKDAQVDSCWIYLFGGFLDTYYRFVVTGAVPSTGMTIDELSSTPTGSDLDSPEKRTRATTHGFTISEGAGAASSDLVVVIAKSELEALIENEALEPGTVPIPDDIVAIAGPWRNRVFMLTAEGWLYVTSQKRPSSTSVYHAIDLRRYGAPYWLANTTSGVVAGFSDDIVRIAGTGDEAEDHVTVDLFGDPLNVGNPPVDAAFATDGNSIVYRSADGLMLLAGASLTQIPVAGTSFLWKGRARHGVESLDTSTGRFRLAVDNHDIYMLAPEGTVGASTDPVSVWRFHVAEQEWSRFTYSSVPLSIHRENAGPLIVGSSTGSIHEIEVGAQDDSADIDVTIDTPWESGGNPLTRKDPADFQIQAHTGGSTGTATFFKDGSADEIDSVDFVTTVSDVYRSAFPALTTFRSLKLRIAGAFNRFSLGWFNVTYRERPQMTMVADPGCIIPAAGGDMAWITEVLIDCISSSDLQLVIYKDDVAQSSITVTVTPGKRTTYRVSVPRGTKARRLRPVILTSAAAAAGSVGFELYRLRVRHRGTGNLTDLPITLAAPAGEAE